MFLLTQLETWQNALRLVTIVGIVCNWLLNAGRIAHVGIIAGSVTQASEPLFELAIIIVTSLALLGTLLHLQLGERLRDWSTFPRVMGNMLRNFMIGVTFVSLLLLLLFFCFAYVGCATALILCTCPRHTHVHACS